MEQNNRPRSTIAKITNFFQGNSSTNKKLSIWKQSGEQDEWAKKAVDVLVKKLKKQPNALKTLETALATRDPASECVTIPRSIDGRLQISNCKALPHVIYCRVWRWPDLQSHHELRQVKSCAFPFMAKEKTDNVCINPYHYDRVESGNIFPPVLVPRISESVPGFSKLTQMPNQQAPEPERMPTNIVLDNTGFCAPNDFNTNSQLVSSTGQGSPFSSASNYSNGYLPNFNQYPISEATPSPPHYSQENGLAQNQPNFVQVHYEEPEYWASISYYELNSRVGEQFRCSTNSYSIIVDGFTNPSTSNRFCVGQLSNVHRNNTIEATRKHIGKGVSISFSNNNELYLECLSDSPVFVQSSMTNHLNNYAPNAVCKVPQNCHLKLFDCTEFYNLLSQVVHSGFEATYKLTKMCTIRMSFVKGWGAQYHRQDVTSTPCWIEIHLNGPLKWLDECLMKMGSPLYNITSVS